MIHHEIEWLMLLSLNWSPNMFTEFSRVPMFCMVEWCSVSKKSRGCSCLQPFNWTWLLASCIASGRLCTDGVCGKSAILTKTPFQLNNCKLHAFTCSIWLFGWFRCRNTLYFHGKKCLEKLHIFVFCVKEKFSWHFLVTTFFHLAIKKKTDQLPVGTCQKKC